MQIQSTTSKDKNNFYAVLLFLIPILGKDKCLLTCRGLTANQALHPSVCPCSSGAPSSGITFQGGNSNVVIRATTLELSCWQGRVRCALEMLIDRANMCFVNSASSGFSTWLSTRHKYKSCACWLKGCNLRNSSARWLYFHIKEYGIGGRLILSVVVVNWGRMCIAVHFINMVW